MATSNSIDFSVDRDEIITEALEIMGVLAAGDTPDSDDVNSLSRTLNLMVKAWQAEGENLFAIEKVYVFLQKDQREYSLGTGSSDHYTTSFTQTSLSADASSSDTSISVDSVNGVSDGDNIGIELDDGSMHWDTVDGSPSGSTINLDTGLTGSASDNAVVYAYTSKASRPMKILNQVIRDKDERDIPLNKLARGDYVSLPDKTSDGTVISIYYDPQVSAGKLYVWPETDNVSDYLVLWVQRTLEDFDAASDTADFPQEWYLALAWGLADLAKVKYGVPSRISTIIKNTAALHKYLAQSFDAEDYIKIEPDNRG